MTFDFNTEKKFILDFIKENKELYEKKVLKENVRALVTAFCHHQDVEVDTHQWDWLMWDIYYTYNFDASFNELDNYMAKYLV